VSVSYASYLAADILGLVLVVVVFHAYLQLLQKGFLRILAYKTNDHELDMAKVEKQESIPLVVGFL
jgi:hypothetical protein